MKVPYSLNRKYLHEHKVSLQMHYGGYCNMCKILNITPVNYCNFTIKIHDETKLKLKESKL